MRPRPGAAAVLYFGGNAEDVSASLPQLAAAYPGHALYLMHYRGYGGSGGTPSEAALQADARALFDAVVKSHPDITLIGRSLGSGIAIDLAASRPARRLVLVTPYDSIENIAASQFRWLPVRLLLRDPYRSAAVAPRIAVPTVLVQAEFDTIIPAASTARLLAAFKPGWRCCARFGARGTTISAARPAIWRPSARGSQINPGSADINPDKRQRRAAR